MDNATVVYKMLLSKMEQMKLNRYIDDTSLIILVFAYAVLIVCSAFGNIVVLSTLIRKPEMRTERNMYIANLAVSDLVLCLFTMPFSLLEIVAKYWPLGEFEIQIHALCGVFCFRERVSRFTRFTKGTSGIMNTVDRLKSAYLVSDVNSNKSLPKMGK